jgi:hypothetical protein
MKIIIYPNEDGNNNETQIIIRFKNNNIFHKYGEICLLNISDYKILFYDCKKGKFNNILLDEINIFKKLYQIKII